VISVPVLHRTRDFLVVDKPSGIPTTSPTGRDCLVEAVQGLAPGSRVMHPTSRLDAEVTGVLVFAITERGIAHAIEARKHHAYKRLYLALSARIPSTTSGVWDVPIGIDPRDARKRIAARGASDAQDAKDSMTRFRVVASTEHGGLLALVPETGRTHQLRVHASDAGCPLYGDSQYGGDKRVVGKDGRVTAVRRVMLHCTRVALPSIDGESIHVVSELPPDFVATSTAIGVDPRASADDALAGG